MDRAGAIAKELTRIREHKRNLMATVEFLRSEMERGKIHLRVNSDPKFRKDLKYLQIAFRIDPDRRYVNPVKGQFSSSKESWQFVGLSELFDESGEIKDEIIINIFPNRDQ